MKIAYLDCLSGISGDMTLGALIDAGVDPAAIQAGLDSLGLPRCQLSVEETIRHGFRAVNVQVLHDEQHSHRHLHHITEMIDGSDLSPRQKELAIQSHQGARLHSCGIPSRSGPSRRRHGLATTSPCPGDVIWEAEWIFLVYLRFPSFLCQALPMYSVQLCQMYFFNFIYIFFMYKHS